MTKVITPINEYLKFSLPKTEEAAFEEKFKYLIVTSPLLNQEQHTFSGQLPFQASRTTNNLKFTANLVTTLLLLLGIERYALHRPIPVLTMTCSASASLFYFYRNHRQRSLRHLYGSVLNKMQCLIESSDVFDGKVQHVLITLQEIELVSRGYRLSTPLSSISSRVEQNSSKQGKCVRLRNRLASILRRAFIVHEEGIIDLVDVIDKAHLLGLYEMYNVNSLASLSAVEAEGCYSLDQLKTLIQVMQLKRRECMVHFLALEADMDEKGWKVVNNILDHFLNEFTKFTKELMNVLNVEFYKQLNGFGSKTQDSGLKSFIHRLSLLTQELKTIEAKIYLCNENVRQSDTLESKQKVMADYLAVQEGFESMMTEWKNGKEVLQSYLDLSENIELIEQEATTTEEEELEESEGKGMVLDSEDVVDILNLSNDTSVCKAIADVVEKNNNVRNKKSRNEKMEEMKLKRIQKAEEQNANAK
ncbi:hypothetical protein G6F57_001788 [Rhizopus arrhizus]|nr:hypothetical protein G6F23_005944 [Rhizopus arrhizus]KAG1425446.1 hypothetical protein G6F58_001911 [Rhizopus delemar]KAG0914645.1 hypothetical protein G6F33_004066 [Rhizopus arrhizus]KAG0948205.1 hypothetical protein G6F30_002877 [Rhizopus arrhizus]KAG0956708.1 hypothetical protein G6F32_001795 [Rhizopus arrhizus]